MWESHRSIVFLILGKKKALTVFPPTLDFLSVHPLRNNHIAYGTALHNGLSERIRSLWLIFFPMLGCARLSRLSLIVSIVSYIH
jgi:hypothetical protein